MNVHVWTETSENNEKHRINRKLINKKKKLVKSRKWADIEIVNASESIGKQYTRCFQPGKNWRSVKLHGWRPYRFL